MFTRRTSAAALAILAALSMSVISGISTIARADETLTGRRVTGGGQYTDVFLSPGTVAVVAVHAIRHQDGTVTGQVDQHYPEFGVSVHGEVKCLFVAGNRAYLSGIITDVQQTSNNPIASFYPVGTYFVLAIEDSGEGHNSSPDRVSVLYPLDTLVDCAGPEALYAEDFYTLLTKGNLQVVP